MRGGIWILMDRMRLWALGILDISLASLFGYTTFIAKANHITIYFSSHVLLLMSLDVCRGRVILLVKMRVRPRKKSNSKH